MANPINKLTDTATTEAATADLEAHVYGVEVDVLDIIAKRLGEVDKGTTPSDVAQMVAGDMPKINKLLRDAGISSAEFIEALFDEMSELNDEWAKEYYDAAGVTQAKVTEDAALSAALKVGKATVEAGVVNVCDSSAAFIFAPDGSLRPISEAYRMAVNDVVRSMLGGEASKSKAVQDAVARLAESGVRVAYGSGKTRELYSAVRQNVQQGYRDTMQALRDEQGRKFGADGVEVSAHGMCAPDHQHIQGRQFTNAEFAKENGKLKRKIGEHNCGHMTFPIIIGVSSNAYTKADRDEMLNASNRKVRYTDSDGKRKECTAYEFTQVQRQMETRIRKVRAQARLMRSAGQSGEARKVDELADMIADDYERVSRQAKVRTRMERTGETVDE